MRTETSPLTRRVERTLRVLPLDWSIPTTSVSLFTFPGVQGLEESRTVEVREDNPIPSRHTDRGTSGHSTVVSSPPVSKEEDPTPQVFSSTAPPPGTRPRVVPTEVEW